MNNDLVHKEYDRNHPFIGCGYGYCDGKLADFSWWKEEREKAQKQGQAWPVTPIRGRKYEF